MHVYIVINRVKKMLRISSTKKPCVLAVFHRARVCASGDRRRRGVVGVHPAIVGDRVAIKIGVCVPDCVYARAAFAWVIVRVISGAEIVCAIGAVIVRAIGRQQSVE